MRSILAPALLALLLGCKHGAPDEGSTTTDADLVARVTASKVGKGEPVELSLRAYAAEGWSVVPGSPTAEGLTVTPEKQEGPTRVGERTVTTWTYNLTGDPGSYIIKPGDGKAAGPANATKDLPTPPIFVDIGVPGPSGGKMADFATVPPPAPPPWWVVAGLAGVGTALVTGIGLWWWRRRHRVIPVPLPDPPDVIAIRAWEEARVSGLDDHALALALSRILRVYLSAISGFPAPSRTTREILDHFEREGGLGMVDRMRAGRVLDATDRLKFAREGGGVSFFGALDDDFRAVVEATRPRPQPTPPTEQPHA